MFENIDEYTSGVWFSQDGFQAIPPHELEQSVQAIADRYANLAKDRMDKLARAESRISQLEDEIRLFRRFFNSTSRLREPSGASCPDQSALAGGALGSHPFPQVTTSSLDSYSVPSVLEVGPSGWAFPPLSSGLPPKRFQNRDTLCTCSEELASNDIPDTERESGLAKANDDKADETGMGLLGSPQMEADCDGERARVMKRRLEYDDADMSAMEMRETEATRRFLPRETKVEQSTHGNDQSLRGVSNGD